MEKILEELEAVEQGRQLSIIKLSEPILVPLKTDIQNRDSDRASTSDTNDIPTPASLKSELCHYQELFTKLRFSYVEQVTKEKFLRAVVGEPPLFVSTTENVAIESQLLELKASLKSRKVEVANMISELERQGRELSQRYQCIQLQKAQLQSMPAEIENLTRAISSLSSGQKDDFELSLSLPKTSGLLGRREAELENLNQELEMLESQATKKAMELERLQTELKPLETQRERLLSAAEEARLRKERGIKREPGDSIEEKGRWLRGAEATMRYLLESEA